MATETPLLVEIQYQTCDFRISNTPAAIIPCYTMFVAPVTGHVCIRTLLSLLQSAASTRLSTKPLTDLLPVDLNSLSVFKSYPIRYFQNNYSHCHGRFKQKNTVFYTKLSLCREFVKVSLDWTMNLTPRNFALRTYVPKKIRRIPSNFWLMAHTWWKAVKLLKPSQAIWNRYTIIKFPVPFCSRNFVWFLSLR
jgi:hypothetical protein